MPITEIVDQADLRAKALPIDGYRGLHQPMRLALNSGSLRMHGMIAVNICFGVRLQQPSAFNYARARGENAKMPDDFET